MNLPDLPERAGDVDVANTMLVHRALAQVADLHQHTYTESMPVTEKRELDAVLLREAGERAGMTVTALSTVASYFQDQRGSVLMHRNMPASLLAIDRSVTNHKHLTKQVLASHSVPVAPGQVVASREEAAAVLASTTVPLVAKPIIGSGGRGVSLGIRTAGDLTAALARMSDQPQPVLLEEMITGIDLRITTVGGRAVASSLRIPANVTGDGRSTITELIAAKNELRSTNPYLRLNPIHITSAIEHHLQAQGMDGQSVLAAGQHIFLHLAANISAGGDSYELGARIHPDLLRLAERATSCFPSAHHSGIDILAQRLDASLDEQHAVVCEVNLNNDIPLHVFPWRGQPVGIHDLLIKSYRGRIRPTQPVAADLRRSHVEPVALANLANSHIPDWIFSDSPTDETMVKDKRSLRAIDNDHLRRALEDSGHSQVSFQKNLIFATLGGKRRIYHRSGRGVIAGFITQRAEELEQLAVTLGVPVSLEPSAAAPNLVAARELTTGGYRCHLLLVDGDIAATVLQLPSAPDLPHSDKFVGLSSVPNAELAAYATTLHRALSAGTVLSLSFALVPQKGAHRWVLQDLTADPALAMFASPHFGGTSGVYQTVTRSLTRAPHYALGAIATPPRLPGASSGTSLPGPGS